MSLTVVDTIPMRDYIERRIDGVQTLTEKAIEGLRNEVVLQHRADEKALERAYQELNAWKASANEWREAMGDLQANMVSKPEFVAEISSLGGRIASNVTKMERIETLVTTMSASDAARDKSGTQFGDRVMSICAIAVSVLTVLAMLYGARVSQSQPPAPVPQAQAR